MKVDRFSEMGIASLLPGMQFMLDEMQERLNTLKQTLLAFQQHREEGLQQAARDLRQEFGFEAKRRGRPPGTKNKRGGPSKRIYWANMTAEERSAEMRRRRSLWNNPQANAQAQRDANHPRNPNHPGHAEWLTKIRKAQHARWNGLSVAARKKQIKKMVEARASRKESAA